MNKKMLHYTLQGCQLPSITTDSSHTWWLLCLTKYNVMKIYGGNGGIAPHYLNLGTR